MEAAMFLGEAGSTAPMVEKVIVAIIIVVCVILIGVGLSKLLKGDWQNSVTLLLLGAAGVAGSVYWIRHPIVKGGDEGYDDIVPATEGGDDDLYAVGGHESDIAEELAKIKDILASASVDPGTVASIEARIGEITSSSDDAHSKIHDILDSIATALDENADLAQSHGAALKPILDKLSNLVDTVGAQSGALSQKIGRIMDALRAE